MPKEPYIVTRQRFGRIEFIRVAPLSEGCVDAALMIFINLSINAVILALNILIFLIVTAFTGSKGARIASISVFVLITLIAVLIAHNTSVAQQAAMDQTATVVAQQAAADQTTTIDTPTPIPIPTPSPTGTYLGDLWLPSYCQYIGYDDARLDGDTWDCIRSNQRTHIDMTKACRFQYKRHDAYSQQDTPGDALSWHCYTPG